MTQAATISPSDEDEADPVTIDHELLPDGSMWVDPETIPQTKSDLILCLQSWHWRVYSGRLYKIMVKDDDDPDAPGFVQPFKPNQAQREFLESLHTRNVILKARQLGFTTLIAILWLDHALFVANQRCAIIAHTLTDAEAIFRDKVKFAYDNLPASIRASFPLKRESATQLVFAHNNSAMRVAVSVRSSTTHRLHISEMGKIAAKHPGKAVEIVTGALPAVPSTGIAIIESTAEGQSGEFFKIATQAERNMAAGDTLTARQFRFHFFPWWGNALYRMDPTGVSISPDDHGYFDDIEIQIGQDLDLEQRAFYVSVRDEEFGGDQEKMWREYPSVPTECWQRSTEGTYFATQLATARAAKRIIDFPINPAHATNTFWDIGAGDGTGIWLHQHINGVDRFIGYIEGWGLGYLHYIQELTGTGYNIQNLFLPHDAQQKRQLHDRIASPQEMIEDIMPRHWKIHIVDRVETLQHGIEITRQRFADAVIHKTECKTGLIHLHQYRKRWNQQAGAWSDAPNKLEGHSEAADSFRQWAQTDPKAYRDPTATSRRRKRPRASGMAA